MAISTSPAVRSAAIGVVSAALLVGAFALGGVGRGGGSTPAAAATLTSASVDGGRITVTGTGTVTGVPNQLILSMNTQVTGASVTGALGQNNAIVRQVTRALRQSGVPESDIQTSDLQISPNYNNNGNVVNYGVSESLTVTLNSVKRAGGQISAATQAGGNSVSIDDVSLNLNSTSALMANARNAAVANAHTQAEQYAKALGVPLGSVISVTPVPQTSNPTQVYEGANAAAGLKTSTVPISAGTQQLTVQITVVYAV
jgi:uncharacterized protein